MARRAALLLTVGLFSLQLAFAQDLAVSTAWGSTTSGDTRATRESYANSAAQALVSHIASNGSLSDQSNGQALASFYTTLALQDLLSGNQTWKSAVTNNVQTWIGKNDIYGNGTAGAQRTNTNGMQWALAFYYAYKAYGDSSFLTLAQNAWDTTYADFITADMVSKAKTTIPPSRNISLNASTCFQDASVSVGGVFWLPDVKDNTQIQMDTVGPFATLAGYLYEETKNETYKTVGLNTTAFMGNEPLYNSTTNLNHPVIDVNSCGLNTGLSPGFQGWYIQPLSIWANITSDSTLTKRLRQVVSTAAHTSDWTETDGVLLDTNAGVSDNPWDDKAILIRAFGEVLRRFPTSSDLATFVEAFITIQYNGLTSNARSGDNYATVIFGPPPQTYNSNGNIIALDVLNAAFDSLPHNASATSNPTPSSSSGSSKNGSSSTPIGAIVGGVMGGVAVLGALAGAAVWYRRTHRRAGPMHESFDKDGNGDGAAEPFMAYRPEPFTDEPSQPSHYDPWNNDASGSSSAGPSVGPVSAGYSYPPLAAGSAATMHPKLARMNAPPPPTRSLSATSAPPSEVPSQSTQHDAASSTGTVPAENIPELVRGLVNNMLREHGTAPPEYDG